MAGTFTGGVATTTTITFNSTTYAVVSAPIVKGKTRSAVNVTCLGDTTMKYVAGAVENFDEFTITVLDKGTDISTSTASANYVITSTLTDNAGTASVSLTFKAVLTGVKGGEIVADGDRKATVELTFQPTGEAAV